MGSHVGSDHDLESRYAQVSRAHVTLICVSARLARCSTNVPTLVVTADLDLFLEENLEPAIRLSLRPGQGGADLRPYVFVRV